MGIYQYKPEAQASASNQHALKEHVNPGSHSLALRASIGKFSSAARLIKFHQNPENMLGVALVLVCKKPKSLARPPQHFATVLEMRRMLVHRCFQVAPEHIHQVRGSGFFSQSPVSWKGAI